MTKKEFVITAVCSLLTGVLIGILCSQQSGKVVVNGDHNVVRTGYKSYDGNHNGNPKNSGNKQR